MQKVFLIGFMGVGKSTLGKRLAASLNVSFLDTDQIIEAEQNASVSVIFTEFGEDYFRKLEFEVLRKLQNIESGIIATGGGMPCFNNNMKEMLTQGTVIYLSRPIGEILNRLSSSRNPRPLVEGKSLEELKLYVTDLLEKRNIYYEQANLVLGRDHQTVEHVINFLSYIK